ncbi:fimbrial assembly protein [Cellulomonas sp. JZ18]|uniref:fimbrial assembly protein n=1 Tax=Cellulomonas sp. JZ18 TaxID=2654191 RepID=UPI0012D3C9B4|nr:fimbrial assembly protein [Cellulomonas sp. JZ18]QGQ19371.1 fimbrial assembly protein [Cellulomonas sp. JZ18]
MSSILTRSVGTRRPATVGVPAVPQVNLLPPEYTQRQRLRGLKRRLLAVLVGVVAFAVVGYGAAVVSLNDARAEQTRAEDETTRLLQEQAKYSEVPQVLAELDRATAARTLGMSTEILWAPYLRAVGTVMPEGVGLTAFAMDGATPMLAPGAPASPLDDPSVATLTFTAKASQLVDTAAWTDALNAVPGFHGAWVSSATVEEFDGQPVYGYTSRVLVSADAYADRFAPEE